MASEADARKMVEEFETETRADLAEEHVRVVNFCYTCPFGERQAEKERTGNPKVKCGHPATWVPPEPLKVEMREDGIIPRDCPLRVRPITVFLDPREEP